MANSPDFANGSIEDAKRASAFDDPIPEKPFLSLLESAPDEPSSSHDNDIGPVSAKIVGAETKSRTNNDIQTILETKNEISSN